MNKAMMRTGLPLKVEGLWILVLLRPQLSFLILKHPHKFCWIPIRFVQTSRYGPIAVETQSPSSSPRPALDKLTRTLDTDPVCANINLFLTIAMRVLLSLPIT